MGAPSSKPNNFNSYESSVDSYAPLISRPVILPTQPYFYGNKPVAKISPKQPIYIYIDEENSTSNKACFLIFNVPMIEYGKEIYKLYALPQHYDDFLEQVSEIDPDETEIHFDYDYNWMEIWRFHRGEQLNFVFFKQVLPVLKKAISLI